MPSLPSPDGVTTDDSRAILQPPDNAGLPVAGLDLCLLDVEAHNQVNSGGHHSRQRAGLGRDGRCSRRLLVAGPYPKQRESTSSARAFIPGLPRIAIGRAPRLLGIDPVGLAARADVELDLQLSHTADLEQDVVEVVVTFVGKVLEADFDVIAAIAVVTDQRVCAAVRISLGRSRVERVARVEDLDPEHQFDGSPAMRPDAGHDTPASSSVAISFRFGAKSQISLVKALSDSSTLTFTFSPVPKMTPAHPDPGVLSALSERS